jgi:hypothetical protein
MHDVTSARARVTALQDRPPNGLARPDEPPVELLSDEVRRQIKIGYGLRHVPSSAFAVLLPRHPDPKPGDIYLARVEKIGKNTRLELANGRSSTLYAGDLVAVVFGNRYATMQFEGYARCADHSCDMLSIGGLCGQVESKHASVADSTKLCLLGAVGDDLGRPLRLRDFSVPVPATPIGDRPVVAVVCGTAMDAGKTSSAIGLISGLRRTGCPVAGLKITGTAAGRDTWGMLDAGACLAMDFVDGGYASTYLTSLEELLDLYRLLLAHATAVGARWAVVEIADGLLQTETAALLRSPAFVDNVDAFVFAAGDPLAAVSGVRLLEQWGIHPLAICGRVTMSPLAMREASDAAGLGCITLSELHAGKLNPLLEEAAARRNPCGGGLPRTVEHHG